MVENIERKMKKAFTMITALVTLLLVCMSLGSCGEEDLLGSTPDYSLEFEFQELDGQGWYSVAGIGSCVDEHIVIPSTYNGFDVLGISMNAFKDNKNIKSIVIPDSVTNIGRSAFENCSFLEKIDIGDGVFAIENNAFAGCVRVKELRIGKNLRYIRYNSYEHEIRAFEGCASRLESIYVSPENEYYECINNCLIDKGRGILVLGCKNSDLSTTPDYVASIAATAFKGCIGLKSVELPPVLLIGDEAFAECPNLESVAVNAIEGYSVTFGEKAFYDCPKLAAIDCSKTDTFSDHCLDACPALGEVNISIHTRFLGFMSFTGNTKIIYEGNSHEWESMSQLDSWWLSDEAPQVIFANIAPPSGKYTQFGDGTEFSFEFEGNECRIYISVFGSSASIDATYKIENDTICFTFSEEDQSSIGMLFNEFSSPMPFKKGDNYIEINDKKFEQVY